MSYEYDPEIEEEDEGYSIPKILVALLLLILFGAGGYIIYQNKEIKQLFNRYESQKKSIENELDQMILKYNLAIDDNGALASDLEEERDLIIRFRDSVKRIKDSDQKNIEEYNKTLKALKDNSAIVFDAPPNNSSQAKVEKSVTKPESNVETTTTTENAINTVNNEANNTKTQNIDVKNNTDQQKDNEEAFATTGPQSFEKVEVPPSFPGCSGDVKQKKACFNAKVKSTISSKFNTNIITNTGLSGTQRVWVSFIVDKFGNVSSVKARGGNAKMEGEAVRVTKMLPKMTPARQNGIPVDVIFNVPITFLVE